MIQIIIGNQGSGKSCYATLIAQKYVEKGFKVFANLPTKNCYKFDKNDIMNFDFPKGSVLLFDEGATYGLGSRGNQYKTNTTSEIVEFFTMHRHYNITDVIIVSPNFTDVIPAVRDNATKVTLISRGFLSLFGLVSKREIIRGYQIDELSSEIKYAYKWKSFSTWWFNPKKAYPFFDSWVRKDLPTKDWGKWSDSELPVNETVNSFSFKDNLNLYFKGFKDKVKLPYISKK